MAGQKNLVETQFFTGCRDSHRYQIQEIIGEGTFGIVASAIDTLTCKRVAIKKIKAIFEDVSQATCILREIKFLRLLKHPNIVDIKHVLLPPSLKEFKDIYIVFELMDSDLNQVIKAAKKEITAKDHRYFMYQLLRALKFMHETNVFHRDLKTRNILVNAEGKVKICDFGLSRLSFHDDPLAVFWSNYVGTRFYRAPELCGSFSTEYTPAIDMWSVGCIFGELLKGKPLFRGNNVLHQLNLITDLLGTPSSETLSRISNEQARTYLCRMGNKEPLPLSMIFPKAEPMALDLLKWLLAFDAKDRPTAEAAMAHPYFKGVPKDEPETCASTRLISKIKLEFDFDRRKLTMGEVKELIYREILEYHPVVLRQYLCGNYRPIGYNMSYARRHRERVIEKKKYEKGILGLVKSGIPTQSPKDVDCGFKQVNDGNKSVSISH